MINLFDILQQAQGGHAVGQMADQFQMKPEQMETALAALMPAFSQGFKRNTADPMSIGHFMQAIAGGQHAKYFDDMTNAFQPAGIEDGNGILAHLFGSKDVSRAVAKQAAQATGIGQDLLKQMLPVLASTLMGGLFKQMTGQTLAAPHAASAASAASDNVFGQVIEQMMANSGMAQKPVERTPNPMDNPFGKALEQMFGGAQGAPQTAPQGDANPWGKILQDMMAGAQKPSPTPQPTGQKAPYEDLFGEMFETGRKNQEQFQGQYKKSMEQVFDNYMRGMDNLNRR